MAVSYPLAYPPRTDLAASLLIVTHVTKVWCGDDSLLYSFMGKVRNFYITTSLSENERYYAGSVVEGKVIFLTKPKAINGPLNISLAWPDRFFPFFFVVAEKRVWNSLQAVLVLAPSDV